MRSASVDPPVGLPGHPGIAWHRGGMDAFRLLATVLVMTGVVVAILLFEKRRAEDIRRDTRRMAEGRDPDRDEPPRKDD